MDVAIACGAGSVAGLAAFYRLARPHFSIRVNCHFCNQDSRVAYSLANSFTCPQCDQYNGWDNEGDYNKELGGTEQCRYVREQVTSVTSSNGLCRGCNLNQELKVAQLAKFPREGKELEEYREHLEKVYRLCPGCEDVLAVKLGEQDRRLANKLIEFKLERSRLNSSNVTMLETGKGWLPYVQCTLAIVVFSLLQDYDQFLLPGGVRDTLAPVINATIPMQMIISTYLDTMFPFISLTEVIAPFTSLLSLAHILIGTLFCLVIIASYKRSLLPLTVNLLLLAAYCTNIPHVAQLSLAGVGVILAVLTTPPTPHNTIITSKGSSKLSESFLHYQTVKQTPVEQEDTLTQALLDTSCDSLSPTKLTTPKLRPEPAPLPPVTKVFSTSTPPSNTPAPMRNSNEFSFIHEFATQQDDDDCDLSSLSLGEIPKPDNSRTPFPLSEYSPCSPTNSLFSPTRPLLHPSRLTNTSWVAGGYWTPPEHPQSLSRSSSHSSGFVSGTPSLANCPSPPGSLHNYGSPLPIRSLPGFPNPTSDIDRFSVLSEPAYQFPHLLPHHRTYAASVIGSPDPRVHQLISRRQTLDDRLSDTSMDRHSQMSPDKFNTDNSENVSKAGWSLTITITPTGLILALSIAVNVALAVMWFRQRVDEMV